ncbi:hypothetical protein KAR91_85775, partial [Candidatus Pacearchaeota archaeon]|nr:hypothetical protein [Candidatus Pacearchaeota archaeon]
MSSLSMPEVIAGFKSLGCNLNIVSTKHPDYKRGFILDSRNVTLGRMTILRGEYDRIKWYWRQYGSLNDSDFLIYSWYL